MLLFIVLGIYIINLSVWPEWLGLGLDGSVGDVGTDSPRFYLGLVSDDKLIPQGLDKDMFWFIFNSPYVNLLKIVYPFSIYHPLTILIPNILGLVFVPYYTYKVALKASNQEKVAKLAFYLVLFCPALITNGAILLRDGWTAFFTIASIYYAQEKKVAPFLIAIVLLSYLRISTGILVLVCSMLFWKNALFVNKKYRYRFIGLIFIIIVSLSFLLPVILDYIQTKNISFGRMIL